MISLAFVGIEEWEWEWENIEREKKTGLESTTHNSDTRSSYLALKQLVHILHIFVLLFYFFFISIRLLLFFVFFLFITLIQTSQACISFYYSDCIISYVIRFVYLCFVNFFYSVFNCMFTCIQVCVFVCMCMNMCFSSSLFVIRYLCLAVLPHSWWLPMLRIIRLYANHEGPIVMMWVF